MTSRRHPYASLPDYAFWRRSVASIDMKDVDPVTNAPFRLSPTEKIATAGSCFAQNVARYLQESGFNYFVTEAAHPVMPPEVAAANNYGAYTARYGNIYTARQLLQLIERVYGRFSPEEDVWEERDGSFVDPFRPNIQPNGFASIQEYSADRDTHFSAVREAFENLDVFVFTLGLTEAWVSKADGAVYTICPGVSGGEFDDGKYEFKNFSVGEICEDMLKFIDALRVVNPSAKIVLTVSPVPLIATAEDRHVLVSSTYSKSALRVACEYIARDRPDVAYFPSYEIATGGFTRGAYFEEDLRSVTDEGVAHIMGVFIRHFTVGSDDSSASALPMKDRHIEKMTRLAKVNCDEEDLDP